MALAMFQPSPDPRAGCNVLVVGCQHKHALCFNPHPTREPDATLGQFKTSLLDEVFQPSPDPRAGCNACSRSFTDLPLVVSTLTRPESRVQLALRFSCMVRLVVSTLTRPESRAQ